ncbi:MAG: protein YgfX, partial [Hafniaceae bacterium]|nr:protein YgfX [Hafniaceae bacterium]
MDQWRCDVRVSWRTQLLLLVTHGILILLILLAPWPEN